MFVKSFVGIYLFRAHAVCALVTTRAYNHVQYVEKLSNILFGLKLCFSCVKLMVDDLLGREDVSYS